MRLGVNIDHVATLRQARYRAPEHEVPRFAEPSVLEAAKAVKAAGADSLTVHLREDRRHVQDSDLRELKRAALLPLNLEMANVPEILEIALELRPAEACLVPERRQEVTTEGGLDVRGQLKGIRKAVERLQCGGGGAGVRVSLFIDPDEDQVAAAIETGCAMVELHTGRFASARGVAEQRVTLKALCDSAKTAHSAGIQVNAGHGLNYENVGRILHLPGLHTLNIGHAIVSRAVFVGLEQAVREMLDAIRKPSPRL
ncbi:MAG: pyridoxine 5'-phosphate synthase [Verrucomicrobiae bacterium]|nr:pyridoxine 5'-phosphate synthase [Verrucomicrobiae bacterium]